MGIIGGPDRFGLWTDADLRSGTNNTWTLGSYVATGGPDGGPYIQVTGGGGSGYLTNEIPVDVDKSYQMVIYAKTITAGSSGNNAGGHIGFACYDENHAFIDLRNCGGVGNTTLSRPASPGDSAIYITSNSSWPTGSTKYTTHRAYHRGVMFFPADHSVYNRAHHYTRLARVQYYSLTLTDQGDYELLLDANSGSQLNSFNATTFPNFSGYTLPAGTPVSRASAGGTYNYALSNPTYPTTWTRYSTSVFTGESRNSGTPFRPATKYIRFLILRNYNRRTESPQDHVWGLSKFFFGEVVDGREYTLDLV